jgi:hypothetical protein
MKHAQCIRTAEKAGGRHPRSRWSRDRNQEFNTVAAWPAQSFQENTQC